MNDFVNLIFSRLKGAVALAVVAVVVAAVCIAVSYLLYNKKYKGEKKFPLKKIILVVLLIGYGAAVMSITLLRGAHSREINLHLFRAWREAWNTFGLQNWLNVLLNVALFVPLGVILPLLWNKLQKWYISIPVGLCSSLAVEIVQVSLGRGIFDIDDLFCNTLGYILGYGLVMLVLSIIGEKQHKLRRSLAYSAIPLAIIIGISSIFIAYEVQEYGNLPEAAIFKTNTRGVEWTLSCELDDEAKTVPTYKTEKHTKKSCDEFGLAFMEMLGVTGDVDVMYYDNETYYSDHQHHFLSVSHFDGTYEYRGDVFGNAEKVQADRETIENALLKFGITIPDNATFTYENDGWHLFEVPMDMQGENLVGGTLRCQYQAEGEIVRIYNNLVNYKHYADEEIISEADAYEKLKDGHFYGIWFELRDPDSVEVVSCNLEYVIDTKGFHQPVYWFEVKLNNTEGTVRYLIPAMK